MEMLTGNGMPSKRLDGEIGQHYKDLDTGDIYECKFAEEHSPLHGELVGGYVWARVARGDHMEVCAGGSGEGGAGGYEFVIRSDGGGPYYWAKGNGLDFINRLIDGPSPLVCIHSTNGDHEYPSVQMYFPTEIAIASGSGKWCGIFLGENSSGIYINLETGEFEDN